MNINHHFFINANPNPTQTKILTPNLTLTKINPKPNLNPNPNSKCQNLILTLKKVNEKYADEYFSFLFYSLDLKIFSAIVIFKMNTGLQF